MSSFTVWEPMYPAPPVTRMEFGWATLDCKGKAAKLLSTTPQKLRRRDEEAPRKARILGCSKPADVPAAATNGAPENRPPPRLGGDNFIPGVHAIGQPAVAVLPCQ